MWREATGEPGDPFLVGLAAQRSWLESNRVLASRIARLFAAANGALRRNPQLFVELHSEIGIKDNEKAAIDLLPSRLADVYPVNWDGRCGRSSTASSTLPSGSAFSTRSRRDRSMTPCR